jgi:hypothetical protein
MKSLKLMLLPLRKAGITLTSLNLRVIPPPKLVLDGPVRCITALHNRSYAKIWDIIA